MLWSSVRYLSMKDSSSLSLSHLVSVLCILFDQESSVRLSSILYMSFSMVSTWGYVVCVILVFLGAFLFFFSWMFWMVRSSSSSHTTLYSIFLPPPSPFLNFFTSELYLFFTMCSFRVPFIAFEMAAHLNPYSYINSTNLKSSSLAHWALVIVGFRWLFHCSLHSENCLKNRLSESRQSYMATSFQLGSCCFLNRGNPYLMMEDRSAFSSCVHWRRLFIDLVAIVSTSQSMMVLSLCGKRAPNYLRCSSC